MKKPLITLDLKDKNLLRKPGVKKWLRKSEKVINKLITGEVLAHITLGLPIKIHDDHIECVYPYTEAHARSYLKKYVNELKKAKNFSRRS